MGAAWKSNPGFVHCPGTYNYVTARIVYILKWWLKYFVFSSMEFYSCDMTSGPFG